MAAKSVQAELDEPERPESSESEGEAPTDGAQSPPADDPFSAAEETEPPAARRKGKASAGRKRSPARPTRPGRHGDRFGTASRRFSIW